MSPVLAVGLLTWGVGGVISGAPALRIAWQVVLAFVMVCNAIAARGRVRRDEFPDERRAL
ncbi:hypothetical protein [Streptomyces sp. GZWMJZ-114]|uniref:hypothetical protein n=1 Tax=Streptomyces sp. GZWMJZ-114 TaxID=2494734 RepID=UPI001010745D|nr:hypothetical protein [Streptomyces sp. GZWMJZ-114]